MSRLACVVVSLLVVTAACATGEPRPADAALTLQAETEAANKQHVRRFFEEVWSTGDLSLRDSFLDAEYRGHFAGGPAPLDRDAWGAWFTGFREAFPDARFTVEDIVAEGDLVAARLTMRGTHQGPMSGIPATGREVTVTGMSFERVINGRIVEGWNENDALGMMIQLGVLPPPGQ